MLTAEMVWLQYFTTISSSSWKWELAKVVMTNNFQSYIITSHNNKNTRTIAYASFNTSHTHITMVCTYIIMWTTKALGVSSQFYNFQIKRMQCPENSSKIHTFASRCCASHARNSERWFSYSLHCNIFNHSGIPFRLFPFIYKRNFVNSKGNKTLWKIKLQKNMWWK